MSKQHTTSNPSPSGETQEYARQVIECSTQLFRSQLDLTDNIYHKVATECRQMLRVSEPSEILSNWPKAVGNSIRGTAEDTAGYFVNTISFQKRLFQLMQRSIPEVSMPFMATAMESTHSTPPAHSAKAA